MNETTWPATFVQRMQSLLGSEADAFFAALVEREARGLRVNLLRLAPDEFQVLARWDVEPVPWCPSGFYLREDVRTGKHPYHAAGLFYLQEPSAMAVVEALDVRPGQRVLDLAAAPGGKATHIAALLRNQGLLVANEVEGSRLKGLGENLERWGARNAVILNERPDRLAKAYGATFDRVLLDAPCSGEGMFRKNKDARVEWSPEHVAGCALRQASILAAAARLVRPGGRLVYSTCTFAPEENEERIVAFLRDHPAWELVDIPKRGGMEPGRPEWAVGRQSPELARAARIWPHRAVGEGHFIAALHNAEEPGDELSVEAEPPLAVAPRRTRRRAPVEKPAESQVTRAHLQVWTDFERRALSTTLPLEQIVSHGDQLYLRPAELDVPDGLRIVRQGLWLGTIKPRRFEPSHALALALAPVDARDSVLLDVETARRYLRGETLEHAGPDGWTLVLVDGWPLGWGRRVAGIVKNFYPKGLRLLG